MNVVIIDYGIGNLGSIQNMFKKVGISSLISSSEKDVLAADKLILAGVGAFDNCIGRLQMSGLMDVLNKKVLIEKTPVLGICVGMQMLAEQSEEGVMAGLGWISGTIVKFDINRFPSSLKIPHMGWTDVEMKRPSRLFEAMPDNSRFYFAHSYHALLADENDILLQANYGYEFAAAVEHHNILGVQFHPEKSHKYGMQLLANFVSRY